MDPMGDMFFEKLSLFSSSKVACAEAAELLEGARRRMVACGLPGGWQGNGRFLGVGKVRQRAHQ